MINLGNIKESLRQLRNLVFNNKSRLDNLVLTDNNYTNDDKAKVQTIGVTPDTVFANGADYAEVAIWNDLNRNKEDRLHRFVTLTGSERKIAIANSTSQIVGVTSSQAAFVGNAKDYNKDDLSKAIVGIIGVVNVKTNDSTIVAGDRVMSDDNGYAIKSSNNCGYRVLSIDNGLLEIVVSSNTDMIQRIKDDMSHLEESRVLSLDDTYLDCNKVIETVGIPIYVSKETINNYSQFNITDYGWYIFSRIKAKNNVLVENGFEITGSDGFIEPEIGSYHVDLAIKFGVAAESRKVNINWGSYSESFIFRATDLAIRNLDQRVTYYVYDIDDYANWEYSLTTDTKVVEGKRYYLVENGEYKLAELTVGASIPSNTYYNHSKVTFEGFPRNISYQTDIVDCPVVIVPPVVEENGYGAWFEIQTTFDGAYSVTVLPQDNSKVSTTFVQAPAKGINMLNLQYHVKEKCWMIANNKWAIS